MDALQQITQIVTDSPMYHDEDGVTFFDGQLDETYTAEWQAAEWLKAGFTPEQVSAWLSAGCISPDGAAALRSHGITPQESTRVVDYHGQRASLAAWAGIGFNLRSAGDFLHEVL